jgi:hypothetical protein
MQEGSPPCSLHGRDDRGLATRIQRVSACTHAGRKRMPAVSIYWYCGDSSPL